MNKKPSNVTCKTSRWGGLQKKRQSKSKAKNKKPPVKNEKISKYFPQNQVESKTCNQVLDDSFEDFKSPVAIKTRSQTTWNLNKNPPKTRTTGRKKVAKNSTIEIIKENFGVNGEHMQMAIALSKSTFEAEYGHSSDSASKTETPDLSAVLQNVKPTSLEQFGFKSAKSVLPVLNPKPTIVNQPSKKNRFKYITPILNLRSKEERESLIEQKISEILKSSVPVPQTKFETNIICHSVKLQNLIPKNRSIWTEIDYFYVDSLGLEKDACKCGSLLRDWSSIPGRDKSPVRTVQKPSQQVEESSDSRCLSPDLFESEDELDKESLEKSKVDTNSKDMNNSQKDNKQNMPTKANFVETAIDLTGSDLTDKIGSSSSAKPASFYSLDEFVLDDEVFCGKGNNEIENRTANNIKPLTAEEFSLDKSSNGSFQKCDGKTVTSRVILPIDDPKPTDFTLNSLKEGLLEDEFMIEDHYSLLENNVVSPHMSKYRDDIVNPDSADYNLRNASPKNTNSSSQDINKDQSQFANEINVKNLDSREDLLEAESPVCIEISDDSSIDSISQNSLHKRKFNDEKMSFDFSTSHILANNINSPPNSSSKQLSPNSTLKDEDEFVNNDLTVNYEVENEIRYSFAKGKILDHEQFKTTVSAELTHETGADDFNDSLTALMECIKSGSSSKNTVSQSSVAKQCVDTDSVTHEFNFDYTNDTLLVSKESKNSNMDSSDLEGIDAVNHQGSCSENLETEEHSPKTSSALCIEIPDDSSTDENNVYFQSNLTPTTPKTTNFISKISEKSPNKKSLNINSAELNITDYVQEMLNKDKYSFDDAEVKLSQSSQIDDEELNYSCHFNTPLKSHYTPNLENHIKVPTKQNSPPPQSREKVNTPDNYIIKTRNVTPMPDFDSMTTPVINKELEKVGVKALKRARGAQLLKYIYESTHPLIDGVNVQESDDEGQIIKRRKRSHVIITDDCDTRIKMEDSGRIEILGDRLLQQEKPEDLIFERRRSTKIPSCPVPLQIVWHNLVSANPSIRESILLYEPLHLESLHGMLKQLGYKYHIQDVLSFLDKKCITIRTAQGKRPNR